MAMSSTESVATAPQAIATAATPSIDLDGLTLALRPRSSRRTMRRESCRRETIAPGASRSPPGGPSNWTSLTSDRA